MSRLRRWGEFESDWKTDGMQKFLLRKEEDFGTWWDVPIMTYNYGGRGSVKYKGPIGFQMMMEEMAKKGRSEEELARIAKNLTSTFEERAQKYPQKSMKQLQKEAEERLRSTKNTS